MRTSLSRLAVLAAVLLATGCRARCAPCTPEWTPERSAVGAQGGESAETPEARTIRDYQNAHADELLRGIDDPDTVVDWAYVTALIEVRGRGAAGSGGRGWGPHGPHLTDAEQEEIGSRLQAALPAKRGEALFAAVETAARLQLDKSPAFREAALRAWPGAPMEMRTWLLFGSWSGLRDPRMTPLLVAEIEGAPDRPVQWHVDNLPTMALKRYVEMEPDKGRALVLADIGRKQPRFGGVALTSLPDEHLEEVDANFRRPRAELTHGSFDMEKHARLAERYGGEDALKTARALLDDPGQVWNTHLLRVVMSRDREDAFQRIAKALATRDAEHPYRHRLVLRAVLASNWIGLDSYWGPDTAAFVRRYVDDPDSRVAEAATRLLEEHAKPEHAGVPK